MMRTPSVMATVLVLSVGLAGCGGGTVGTGAGPTASTAAPVTPKPSPSPVPTKPVVNRKDPASVAAAFVVGAYAWDTTRDRTRTDALKRVAPLATKEFAKDFVAPQKPSSGAQWLTAAQHQAASRPTIEVIPAGTDYEINPDAPFRILAFRAQWIWQGQDGVQSAGGDELATVTLDQDDTGNWHVSAFSTTNTGH